MLGGGGGKGGPVGCIAVDIGCWNEGCKTMLAEMAVLLYVRNGSSTFTVDESNGLSSFKTMATESCHTFSLVRA